MADQSSTSSRPIMLLPLPRELRDAVYRYLWDEKTLNKIRFGLEPAPDNYPGRHQTTNKQLLPWFLKPKHLGREMTEEIVESFYRNYSGFRANSVRQIKLMLQHDFFDLNLRLCDHTISALTVDIHVDPSNPNYLCQAQLKSHMSTLIDLPVLAANFTLTLRLSSKYDVAWFNCVCSTSHMCPVRLRNVGFAAYVTDALKGVREFVSEFERERERKVVLCLEVGKGEMVNGTKAKSVIGLTLDDIDNDQEKWLYRLREMLPRM